MSCVVRFACGKATTDIRVDAAVIHYLFGGTTTPYARESSARYRTVQPYPGSVPHLWAACSPPAQVRKEEKPPLQLAVSRAFGDLELKQPVCVVTAEPEITCAAAACHRLRLLAWVPSGARCVAFALISVFVLRHVGRGCEHDHSTAQPIPVWSTRIPGYTCKCVIAGYADITAYSGRACMSSQALHPRVPILLSFPVLARACLGSAGAQL